MGAPTTPGPGESAATLEQVESVEVLYRERFVTTSRLAFLLTGDSDAADELAQEAFVRLYRNIADVENPGGFLRTALVNLCHDHRRRRDTVKRHPPLPRPPSDPPDLPRELDATWRAVQALPERRRDAVVLHYYADLSVEEIARLLDTRPATVRSLLHRGRNALREVLTDDR